MARKTSIALALDLFQPFEWHHKVYAGAIRYAREKTDWQCIIDEFPELNTTARRGGRAPYRGIIARATRQVAQFAERLDIPLVNVWFNSPVRGLPGVHADPVEAGRQMAEHLLGRGFKRFGYAIQPGDRNQKLELKSFTAEVSAQGYSVELAKLPRISSGQASKWRQMQETTNRWLDSLTPPVGICIREPHLARQIEHLCGNRDWRVPQDVAILCSTNEDTICNHPDPGLSTVDHNWDRVGYEAAHLLHQLMRGKRPPEAAVLISPSGIRQRASTDFFAVEDELVSQAMRFIAANLSKPINVGDVVAAVGVSRSTLERSFQAHVGLPISKEIMRLRLERVKRQLTERKTHLKRIAHDSGFADATTLCRVFHRELGLTPGQYRKQVISGRK